MLDIFLSVLKLFLCVFLRILVGGSLHCSKLVVLASTLFWNHVSISIFQLVVSHAFFAQLDEAPLVLMCGIICLIAAT